VLSEYTSDDSTIEERKRKKIFPNIFLFNSDGEEEKGDYIDFVVNEKSRENKRLLSIYTSKDKHRNDKWVKKKP
jgi:hypothetical protein